MAIDSHMHINSLVPKEIEKEILDINNNSNLKNVINVSLNSETAEESIIISNSNAKFYSAIDIHPLYGENQSIDDLYDIALNEKVVAIGEIGLDTTKDNIELQKKYLIEQISIANSLNLPVIIHANNSNKLVIEIFNKSYKKDPIRLIGVRLADLQETKERQMTLFEENNEEEEKEEEIQKTIDDINQKFGKSIIAPASLKIIGNPKSKRNMKD